MRDARQHADIAMANGFSLTFTTYMTPWTQDCMFFVTLTLSDAGIGVAPDPRKRGLGQEEQWFAPWSDVMSLQHVRPPEPIVRIEFPTSEGQTAIRDIRVPPVADGPFAGVSGAHLVEAVLLAYQETHEPPSVAAVARMLRRLAWKRRPAIAAAAALAAKLRRRFSAIRFARRRPRRA